jgi:branched-chain amino acid transport system permease protein
MIDRLIGAVRSRFVLSEKVISRKIILLIVVVAIAGIAIVALPPWAINNYWLRVMTQIMMVAILASSWNVVAGFCGYFSFGNVVFFGLGAYTTAVLMSAFAVPFALTILLGAVVASVFAIAVGIPLLRLKGHYFAIATLGINLGMREVATNLDWTGGGKGIWLQLPDFDPRSFSLLIFFLMAALLAISLISFALLLRSRAGYAMRAIRGNEESAEVLGINTTFYKVLAFAFSAFFSGMAGSVYIFWLGYMEPNQAFDMTLNIQFVMAGLLGGLGTLVGPILGAVVLQLLSELIWSHFLEVHLAVLGIVIIAVVLFLPNGLAPFLRVWLSRSAAIAK